MNPLTEFRTSPAAYPHTYDVANDALGLVSFTEADFCRASFLDQRALTPQTRGQWLRWPQALAAIGTEQTRDCQFIFHIGHVGSTLMSRLIGEHPDVLALREPLPLRTLAQLSAELDDFECYVARDGYDARADALLHLLSRRFRSGQRVNVKATSYVSEIAANLLRRVRDPAALFMYVPADVYVASILAGEASRGEMRETAGARLRRLHRRSGDMRWRLHAMSEGERIAMSWACEMTALIAAETALPGAKIGWVDFERMLGAPAETLSAALDHFGRPMPAENVDRIVAGPLMRQYSKAPEHGYTPQLRRDVLAQARREHAAELRKGLAWLEHAAASSAAIAAAMERAARG
jgi:hypothetical protein